MYIYRVRKRGNWYDYSIKYDTKKQAEDWYKVNGAFLSNLSNRNIVLFKNSKKGI